METPRSGSDEDPLQHKQVDLQPDQALGEGLCSGWLTVQYRIVEAIDDARVDHFPPTYGLLASQAIHGRFASGFGTTP